MNCKQSQQLLIEYIDDALRPELATELEVHLHSCAKCRTEHEALQATLAKVSENPIPQPDESFWNAFPDQVLDSYKNQEQAAEEFTPDKLTAEKITTGTSYLQTIRKWLLPNGWPQLATQAMVVTVAIVGIVFWSFQSTQIQFDSAKLQAQLVNGQNLAATVKKHTFTITDSNTYSFGDKPAQTDFFKTGRIYSESLALLTGNDINALQQHLILLGQTLSNMPVKQKLNEIKATMTKGTIEQDNLLAAIARLQPDLEKQAAKQSEKDLLLFQLGSWLNDVKLAAALKNPVVLTQPQSATYLLDAMRKQNMPKGAITNLERIIILMQSTSLSEEDYMKILRYSKTIQHIMG